MERALETLDHDPTRDRLFSVGDLIDYGTRSDDALEWNRSRFAAVVRGNHEQMMLDWLWGGARMHTDGGAWRGHWTSWWFPMSRPREQHLAWLKTLCRLPFAATVRTQSGARIALVHGYPVLGTHVLHWTALCEQLTLSTDTHNPIWANPTAELTMWGRPEVRTTTWEETLPPGIEGVDLVLHGHDPAPESGWTAQRMLCIDTAAQLARPVPRP